VTYFFSFFKSGEHSGEHF